MAEITEELKKEVQDILDREKWQGYVSGKVEGALNVLYALDLSKEKRLELLSDAAGLSRTTAEDFLGPREIEERIYKNENLSDEDKGELDALMSNDALKDETVIDNPRQTLSFLALEEQACNLPEKEGFDTLKMLIMLIVDGTDPDLVEEMALLRYFASDLKGYKGLQHLIMMIGAMGIQAGENPRVFEEKIVLALPKNLATQESKRIREEHR